MQLSKEMILAKANEVSKNTLMETLDIEMVDYGEDFLVARMPVTPKVHQPDGVLHGGATAALAESVGSFASHIFIDLEEYFVRGLEITANHLKSVKEGYVYATAKPKHIGKSTSVWDVQITNEEKHLISQISFTAMHKDN